MCCAQFSGRKSGSHGSFQVLALSVSWFHPYLAESHHMWHTYKTLEGDVSRPISRTKAFKVKGQNHMGRFKSSLVLSIPWLRHYLTESLYMWQSYNT